MSQARIEHLESLLSISEAARTATQAGFNELVRQRDQAVRQRDDMKTKCAEAAVEITKLLAALQREEQARALAFQHLKAAELARDEARACREDAVAVVRAHKQCDSDWGCTFCAALRRWTP